MFRLLVDFNDIRDDTFVTGLASDVEGTGELQVSDSVLLHDDGEHEVWGTVSSLEGDLVHAQINWATWGPPRERVTHPQGLWVAGSPAVASGPQPEIGPTVPDQPQTDALEPVPPPGRVQPVR